MCAHFNTQSREWLEVKRKYEWNFGYVDPQYPLLKKEVQYHRIEQAKPANESKWPRRQKGDARIDCGDRVIIGVRVKSGRETDLNGWWRPEHGGG